nr:ribonuclease H-like domain-containing protein [Tanacetum cinerariifolium]GEZ88646.1 ribonuclease H-like domain-containing protein [Tanacetum cinerariifolium]
GNIVLELLHEFGLLGCIPVLTPLPENIVLAHKETKDDNQHMHAPLQSHFNLALRLLRYLKLAPGSGIVFSKDNFGIQVVAYSDSDWAKCPMTRRSVFGYCVFVNTSLATESEYRAMAATTCEVMWIVKILKDLGLKDLLHVELHCDNKPPSAAINFRCQKQGRHKESSSKTRLLSETAATISTFAA